MCKGVKINSLAPPFQRWKKGGIYIIANQYKDIMTYYNNEQVNMCDEDDCHDYFDNEEFNDYNKQSKNYIDLIKEKDKNYEKFSVPFNNIWKDGKFYKTLEIENFGSGSHGTWIRNAVTGIRTNIKVGSKDEDLFFKVSDTTRDRKARGRMNHLLLYYDTPEQYENHRLTKVSPHIKSIWVKKSLEAQKRNLFSH